MKSVNCVTITALAIVICGAVRVQNSTHQCIPASGMGGMKMGPMPSHMVTGGKLIDYRHVERIVKAANSEGTVRGSKKISSRGVFRKESPPAPDCR